MTNTTANRTPWNVVDLDTGTVLSSHKLMREARDAAANLIDTFRSFDRKYGLRGGQVGIEKAGRTSGRNHEGSAR